VDPEKRTAKWVPVEVDMTYQVIEAELSEEEAADPATAVEKYMGRLISNPEFDPEMPMWRGYLVHTPAPPRSPQPSSCKTGLQLLPSPVC